MRRGDLVRDSTEATCGSYVHLPLPLRITVGQSWGYRLALPLPVTVPAATGQAIREGHLGWCWRPRPGPPASHDHSIFGAGRGFMGIACLLRLPYWFMDMTRLSLDRLLARSLARSLAGSLARACLLVATLRVMPPSSFGASPLSSAPFPTHASNSSSSHTTPTSPSP